MTGATVRELFGYFLDLVTVDPEPAEQHDEPEQDDTEPEPDEHEDTEPGDDRRPSEPLTVTVTLDTTPCAGCHQPIPPADAIIGHAPGRPLCRPCLAELGLTDVADTITAALWARLHLDSLPPLSPAVLHLWRLHDAALAWAADRAERVEVEQLPGAVRRG